MFSFLAVGLSSGIMMKVSLKKLRKKVSRNIMMLIMIRKFI